MNLIKRTATNAVSLFAVQVITLLTFLLLSVLIARKLGDTVFGQFSFAYALTSILAVFLNLGFDTIIVREVVRDRSLASKYMGNVGIIKGIFSLVMIGIVASIVSIMHYSSDTSTVLFIFSVYMILSAFTTIFKHIFRAFERMEYEALSESIGRIVTFLLCIGCLFLGYGLIFIAWAFVVGAVFDLIVCTLICIRRFAKPRFEVDFEFWKKTSKVALPIGFLSLASIIFVRTDTVMLSFMKGDEVVGWYSAAQNLVFGLKPIPLVIASTILPMMSRFYVTSPSSLKITFEKALTYLVILVVPIALGTTILANNIIHLFYGDEFTISAAILQVLVWDALVFFLYHPMSALLVSINRQNTMGIAGGTCVIVNIILNLLLIPHFSYIGAAIATLSAETLLLCIYSYLVFKHLYHIPFARIIVRPLIASVIMGVLVYFCRNLNIVLVVILAAIVYFGILFLIKGVSKDDIQTMKQYVKM